MFPFKHIIVLASIFQCCAFGEDISREEIIRTVEHMQALNKETLEQLAQANSENLRISTALTSVQTEVSESKKLVESVQKELAELKQWGIDQQARADKEAKESARRGNFIGWLGAAALGFLAFSAMKLLPMPYAIALPFVAAPIGYFLARMLI